MNKPLFRYITVIAILAVMALQGMWFSNSYHLLENELYDKINNAFLEAQLQESSRTSDRFKNNIPMAPYSSSILPKYVQRMIWPTD